MHFFYLFADLRNFMRFFVDEKSDHSNPNYHNPTAYRNSNFHNILYIIINTVVLAPAVAGQWRVELGADATALVEHARHSVTGHQQAVLAHRRGHLLMFFNQM
jgi:hypothetical protein